MRLSNSSFFAFFSAPQRSQSRIRSQNRIFQNPTISHKLSAWQLVSNAFISFAPRQEIEKKPYEPSSSIIVECWDSLVWNLSYFPTPRNRFLVRKSTTSVVAERISQDSSIQSTSLPKLVCAICRRYHLDIMCMVWWLVEWIEWYLDYIFLALSPSFPQL